MSIDRETWRVRSLIQHTVCLEVPGALPTYDIVILCLLVRLPLVLGLLVRLPLVLGLPVRLPLVLGLPVRLPLVYKVKAVY